MDLKEICYTSSSHCTTAQTLTLSTSGVGVRLWPGVHTRCLVNMPGKLVKRMPDIVAPWMVTSVPFRANSIDMSLCGAWCLGLGRKHRHAWNLSWARLRSLDRIGTGVLRERPTLMSSKERSRGSCEDGGASQRSVRMPGCFLPDWSTSAKGQWPRLGGGSQLQPQLNFRLVVMQRCIGEVLG